MAKKNNNLKELIECILEDVYFQGLLPLKESEFGGSYPATAAEYAEELNSKYESSFKLVIEQEFWEKLGIITGEDLEKELSIGSYVDTYKELYGIKPHTVNFDALSIKKIHEMLEELYKEMQVEKELQFIAKKGKSHLEVDAEHPEHDDSDEHSNHEELLAVEPIENNKKH